MRSAVVINLRTAFGAAARPGMPGLAIALALALALVACSKDGPKGASSRDGVVAA